MQQNSARFVGSKVALDGIIFGPLDLLVFFTYMGFCNGKSAPQVKEDVKRDFIPALALEGGIWPILQVANFRYVPVRYQLLYVNLFCLIDSCFLSWIEQQEDAAWKHWFKQILHLEGQKDKGGWLICFFEKFIEESWNARMRVFGIRIPSIQTETIAIGLYTNETILLMILCLADMKP